MHKAQDDKTHPLSCSSCIVQYSFSFAVYIWAASSEFVSSSIPSWQILTAHAQPFRGAMDLAFCLKVPLDLLLVWASSEGPGETARTRRLAWTFAARIGDKYQIRLTRPIWYVDWFSWSNPHLKCKLNKILGISKLEQTSFMSLEFICDICSVILY